MTIPTLGIPKRLGLALRPEADTPLAAGIVFVAPDGEVLLLRRSGSEKNYGGYWGLPGGKAEEGETAQDAARREFQEECGLDIDLEANLRVMDRVATPNGMLFTTFAQPVEDKFIPALDSEHTGYCWASLDMLPRPLHPSVDKCLSADLGVTADMKPEDWAAARDGLAKWARETDAEDELTRLERPNQRPGLGFIHEQEGRFTKMTGDAALLAMDRNLYDRTTGKRIMGADRMALDRAPSVRNYDADGHLHIARTPISKANVCEYYGHEIPGADKLGLDPQRKYRMLRHPEELAKAAASSNGKQLLLGHVPVSADDPQKDKQVGATGTDAEYEHPYLYNSLHLHDREGIEAIEKADKADQATDDADPDDRGAKELSSAYRYDPDMTPGEYEGAPYDGVMRNIDFNHVALVPEGRAGADVVVGDSKLKTEGISMSKKVLSRFAGASALAMGFYLQPKLAQDAKLDLDVIFDGVSKKNFKEKKGKIASDIKAAAKGKLAKDASIEDVVTMLDRLEDCDVMEGADADPNSGLPMSKEDMDKKAKDAAEEEEKKKASDKKAARDAYLTGKGLSAEDIKAMDDMEGESAEDEFPDKDKDAEKAKDGVSQKAMDAALKKTADDTATRVKREMREVAQAYADVEPYVGKLALGMDSAPDVYRTALKGLGMDAKAVDAMHADALKPVLLAQRKAGEKAPRLANDASPADTTGFNSRWGEQTDRIGAA